MELRIRIRQSPQLNIQGQPIHYAGNSPQSLNVVTAPLPTGRQWPNYGYVDATDDVSDIYKLKLTWTNDRNIDGVSTPGEFQRKRAVSGQLSFEGEAYKNIRKWLIEDISAPLNTVDVQIHHLGCDTYDEFSFKASDLRWCEGQGCVLEVSMKQNDEALDCVRKTMIADNHKNWFQTIPANNKKHPRFGYCNEIRPNGMLICLWYIMNITAGVFFTVVFPIILGYNALVATLKVMIAALNKVLDFLGFNTINFNLDIINFDDLFKPFGQFFVESGGCGREHPAPLIRDYISNVCEKCKITVDHLSAPIFFAEHMPVETSSRGVVQVKNPHYYACYLHAQVKRGIRRFHGLMPLIPGGMGSQLNTTDYYIPDNAPQHTLDTFLDELKGVYNAEWRIVNNTLYFQRRDFFINGGYVLDFSANSADRLKLLEGICYEWNERKYPASCSELYSHDAIDTCGNEALQPMNGQPVSFGLTEQNPTFDGTLNKKAEVGATKFRLDGAAGDYICDALQVIANGATIAPLPSFSFQLEIVGDHFREYADYALLLRDETNQLPKILIWDGVSYENARCVRPHSAVPNISGFTHPVPNAKYNKTVFSGWIFKHPPNTFVLGSGVNFGSYPLGYYTVWTALGIAKILQQPALLVNYPMYFNPYFEDTLWDWFHWIDDPAYNPRINMNFTARVELCCDTLKDLGLFNDSKDIKLGEKVKLHSNITPMEE